MAKEQFYTVAEFAGKVGTTDAVIYNHIRYGRITVAKLGRKILVPVSELDRYNKNLLVQKHTPKKVTVVPKITPKMVQEELDLQPQPGNARVCQLIEIIRFKFAELEVELKRIA
jgi:excisionase family DNA binding protein